MFLGGTQICHPTPMASQTRRQECGSALHTARCRADGVLDEGAVGQVGLQGLLQAANVSALEVVVRHL